MFIALLAKPNSTFAAGQQDYCSFSKRTTLMLVDRTTAYDETDQEIFRASLNRLQSSLETGDRLIIQTITAAYTESQKVFDACMPGCPEAGLMDWLTGSCRDMIARSDRTAFLRRAAMVVRQLLKEVQSHETSDIAQTIAEASRNVVAGSNHNITRLIVFSDMIENSRSIPWSKLQSASPKHAMDDLSTLGIKPSLDGTEVVVFGFGRFHDRGRSPLPPTTKGRLVDFWTRFFKSGKADTVFIGQRWD
jgi:hypothetical protein